MTEEITRILVEAIGSIAILLITSYLIPWLKGKIGEDKYRVIENYTELAVRSAEQLYTPEEWKLKKSYVLSCVTEKLEEVGLYISETELNNIIEGWVNAVKKAK